MRALLHLPFELSALVWLHILHFVLELLALLGRHVAEFPLHRVLAVLALEELLSLLRRQVLPAFFKLPFFSPAADG